MHQCLVHFVFFSALLKFPRASISIVTIYTFIYFRSWYFSVSFFFFFTFIRLLYGRQNKQLCSCFRIVFFFWLMTPCFYQMFSLNVPWYFASVIVNKSNDAHTTSHLCIRWILLPINHKCFLYGICRIPRMWVRGNIFFLLNTLTVLNYYRNSNNVGSLNIFLCCSVCDLN